jgi:branched-chain amino acid transport system permease protein
MQFVIHIIISAIIFALLASGFKFFIKLKWNLDFSYMAIVIFSSYLSALLNINFGIWIIMAIVISFLVSIGFTFFVLFLSKRLNDVYFTIGTLSLYVLVYQLAYNMESITWWALWLSLTNRNLIWSVSVSSLNSFLIFGGTLISLVILWLVYFKKTYFYKTLMWWGEKDLVIKSLWVKIDIYKFGMILITTLLASLAWWLYSFYYLYIDPSTFWFTMLVPILVIVFLSYKRNDWWTLIVSLLVMFAYEYLRFFKIVEPSKIWYFREMMFWLIIVVVSFVVFRKTNFGREN